MSQIIYKRLGPYFAMAPTATTTASSEQELLETITKLASLGPIGHANFKSKVALGKDASLLEEIPASTRARYARHNIDISEGYPVVPDNEQIPKFVADAYEIRNKDFPYIERGKNADPEKKALFGAATEVRDLTKHIGTEIYGLQLADLDDKQKDELALLIAERVVVFFRDQDLSPNKQLELGHYWGQVEVHPQVPRVNKNLNGVTVIWQDYYRKKYGLGLTFKRSIGGNSQWHTDLVHEHQPAGITHLHNDAIPKVGGDTVWASGYAAYDKLSPAFQKFLDGKTAIYHSAHHYVDPLNPLKGPKYVEREHPIIRTHPATGWKSLFVNRSMTSRIVGLEPEESKTVLEFLFNIFEKNLDIQVRFNWRPSKEGLGTSALWDNRISQHNAVWDHEGLEPRHGTRVTSLAEVPYFDPESKSQREALGLSLD
jgi:alpha-ketoglutarate-dependent taurine dioxygenase